MTHRESLALTVAGTRPCGTQELWSASASGRSRPRLVIMVLKAASRPSEGVAPAVWRRNRLLAALPPNEQERLGADLDLVELELRELLFEIDQPISSVYFPVDCVISVLTLVDGEVPIEVATTGFEGMAGLP